MSVARGKYGIDSEIRSEIEAQTGNGKSRSQRQRCQRLRAHVTLGNDHSIGGAAHVYWCANMIQANSIPSSQSHTRWSSLIAKRPSRNTKSSTFSIRSSPAHLQRMTKSLKRGVGGLKQQSYTTYATCKGQGGKRVGELVLECATLDRADRTQ